MGNNFISLFTKIKSEIYKVFNTEKSWDRLLSENNEKISAHASEMRKI